MLHRNKGGRKYSHVKEGKGDKLRKNRNRKKGKRECKI